MMKKLMSATALTALLTATAAYGQQPMTDPANADPPATIESAPGMGTERLAPAPRPFSPEPAMPQSQAEVPTLPPPESDATAVGQTDMFMLQQKPGELLASSLIGSTVENPAGETLGDINDVVLTDQGIVDGIVIGVGGFLGIGEKNVAVSFDAVQRSTDADGDIVLTLNATEQELETAPQYVTVAGLPTVQPTEADKLQE